MNKRKRILALLCCVCLLLCGLPAHAEEQSAAERGLEMLRTAANWKSLVLPQEESYLDEWLTLYPRRAWHAASLQVELLPQRNTGMPLAPFVYEGTEVTVVAEENEMSCMLYRSPDFTLWAGWIPSIRLLEEFPGETYRIGEPRSAEGERLHEVGLKWSNAFFPHTTRLYTVLDEPLSNCAGFVLEYQIIAENNAFRDHLFGDRTVYVHNGREWLAVGSFPYTALGAVRAEVWLDEPVDLYAIATVADCIEPNLFDFRQTARDFVLA